MKPERVLFLCFIFFVAFNITIIIIIIIIYACFFLPLEKCAFELIFLLIRFFNIYSIHSSTYLFF